MKHTDRPTLQGHLCACGGKSGHKVGEELSMFDEPGNFGPYGPVRHNWTTWMCCDCFRKHFGDYAAISCKNGPE